MVLYSLEPAIEREGSEPTLHSFKILGKAKLEGKQTVTAFNAVNATISSWDGMFRNCFDPRQALRIVADNHTYDFLLCYECRRLEIYEDDKMLETLGTGGSPKALNTLLKNLHLPLAKIEH